MSEAGYLTNHFLIAMPSMGDPNFSQTVALVCEHNPRGALGLILNRPLSMRMGEIFEQMEIEIEKGPLTERPVLRGGPMQTDRGFVVHPASGEWDSTLVVSDALHVTTSRDILAAMARGAGPREAVVALGYAGWDGGQLEDEIRANAWLSAPAESGIIFDLPFESRWEAAGRLLGVELSRISAISGNAQSVVTLASTTPQLVMAFDFGRRRIGVACGDTLSRAASPLAGIDNGAAGPRWDALDSLMRSWQPALLVVGLPYNVDGTEGAMGAAARRFADELARRYALPLRMIDERYSSLEAASRLKAERDAGLRKRRVAKTDVDAAAACVILERWLVESQ